MADAPRTGRRPGPTKTRSAILEAARQAFGKYGYDAVSLRGVARDAGVDPALVHRFFGTKEALFVACMDLPVVPSKTVDAVLAQGAEDLGVRIVGAFLELYDSPRSRAGLVALIRAAHTNERASALLREFLTREMLGRVAASAAPDCPDLRASLAASQIVGLVVARYIIEIPPLATTERQTVAACVGPTLQRYLLGPLPLETAETNADIQGGGLG
jgi:AcrR family transcriptional regulator